jgi:hypothetical protein
LSLGFRANAVVEKQRINRDNMKLWKKAVDFIMIFQS